MSYPIFGSGINIDPNNLPYGGPDPVTGFGMDKLHGFRTVSQASKASYLDKAKLAGKHIMVVVTEQSAGYVYYGADIVQVGNEPDLIGMTPQRYADYWNLYRNTYNNKFPYFALAGLGSGLGNDRAYLEKVWPLLQRKPDLIAVHCYDGDVNQAYNEVVDLWNAVQVPIIVTEWNHPIEQIWDMYAMLNGTDGVSTAWNSFFPYYQAMDPSVAGLLDVNGNPTDIGGAVVSAPNV